LDMQRFRSKILKAFWGNLGESRAKKGTRGLV
jgi:hypothetical protein